MITFDLATLNPVQLAKLYKLLIALYRLDDAEAVYAAAVALCGAAAFCEEVARA